MSADRDRLRRLADATTEGPWFHNGHGCVFSKPLTDEYDQAESLIPDDAAEDDPAWDALPDPRIAGTWRRFANAEFIAACREAVPALLDRLDRCETALAYIAAPIHRARRPRSGLLA